MKCCRTAVSQHPSNACEGQAEKKKRKHLSAEDPGAQRRGTSTLIKKKSRARFWKWQWRSNARLSCVPSVRTSLRSLRPCTSRTRTGLHQTTFFFALFGGPQLGGLQEGAQWYPCRESNPFGGSPKGSIKAAVTRVGSILDHRSCYCDLLGVFAVRPSGVHWRMLLKSVCVNFERHNINSYTHGVPHMRQSDPVRDSLNTHTRRSR